jgi:hypothetical protein
MVEMLVCEMERRAARRQPGMTARTVGIRELVIMVGELVDGVDAPCLENARAEWVVALVGVGLFMEVEAAESGVEMGDGAEGVVG